MKTLITIYLIITSYFAFAQPAQTKPNNFTAKNSSDTEKKKELSFAKRKSAFDDNIKTNKEAAVDLNKIWDNPDVEATFVNGTADFIKLIQKNLNVDVPVTNEANAGVYKVQLSVVFDKLGATTSVTPVTNFGFGMEKEAVRVFNLTKDKWKPATVKNKAVNSVKQFTFTFQIKE